MNCRDFKEIADSYLGNELLVETNHEILQHLEHCANCRNELAVRRNLREKLRFAVMNSPDSQINPAFVTRLRANLREEARRGEKSSSWTHIFGLRPIFVGLLAIVVFGLAFGLTQIIRQNQVEKVSEVNPIDSVPTNNKPKVIENLPFQNAAFVQVRKDAVEDHKTCALNHSAGEKPLNLDEAARKFANLDKELGFDILEPIRESCGNDVKLLAAHSCIVNGRSFAHLVLRYHEKVVSVLVAKREDTEAVSKEAISCQTVEGFQTSCFQTAKHTIFVVSEMDEPENLKFARTIEPSLTKQIVKTEQGA